MDTEEGVIRNRLNYVRKYIIKAMEIHQEEKKEKVYFTVDTVCLALRKWSMENCLGMTAAQAIYAEICKVKNLQATPIQLEGKEFAGVNNTFVHHKPEDLSLLEEQFALHGEKKKIVIDYKKVGMIAGGVVLAVALIFGGKFFIKFLIF